MYTFNYSSLDFLAVTFCFAESCPALRLVLTCAYRHTWFRSCVYDTDSYTADVSVSL